MPLRFFVLNLQMNLYLQHLLTVLGNLASPEILFFYLQVEVDYLRCIFEYFFEPR